MKGHRLAAVLVIALSGAIASCTSQPAEEKAAAPAQPTTTPLQRGAYIVAITGCNDCHTPGTFYGAPDMHRALSGSELG